jgi:hypothetical protein
MHSVDGELGTFDHTSDNARLYARRCGPPDVMAIAWARLLDVLVGDALLCRRVDLERES